MIFDNFIKESKIWWDRYLKHIYEQRQEGKLYPQSGVFLYPNIFLATKANGYYIGELIGAQRIFYSLKLIKNNERSIYRYLNQFDDSVSNPLIHLDVKGSNFRFLRLSQEADFEIVKERFPFIELFTSSLIGSGGKGSVFSFGPNFSSCSIENSVLVNRYENFFRCKNILELFIVKSSINRNELYELFDKLTKDRAIKGIHSIHSTKEQSLIIGGHFQSIYLLPGLRETTIGEFIKTHSELIKIAFKTTHFLYEPYFEWVEHDGSVDDKAINPDLMVRRPDGFYDIYDLKTAVLEKISIVKGKRKRRRFIDYVEEGAAQLANYREYFQYAKNRKYAEDRYGIEVQNPKLVLIAGNWDNAEPKELEEACRRYSDISILDFDTFAHLFIGAHNDT